MVKTIAILLNGEIHHDYRVIKVIETLSTLHEVHLFYINGDIEADKQLFGENVTLHPILHVDTLKVKLLRNSFFCYEFNFMIQHVLKTAISFDCIWANDLTTLFPAYKISRKLNAKLIYDSHEIYLETLNQYFPREASGLKKIIIQFLLFIMHQHGEKLERKLIKKSQLFITVNESLMSYFNSKYSFNERFILMNLPRIADETKQTLNIREKYSWESESIVVLYQGALNEGRGLKLLIETFSLLPKEYKLIILGKGTLKQDLIQLTTHHQLNHRIQFVDRVDLSDLPVYTNSCDIGVNLLESYNLSKQMASPNKLFEYIFAGIPIVASNTIENKKILDSFAIGSLTENKPEEIKKAILSVKSLNKTEMMIQFLEAKKIYNWESQESKLLSLTSR